MTMWCGITFKQLALLIVLQVQGALAFNFAFGAPTECDNLNITWSGGRTPFYLFITPLFNPPLNITIPDSAFVDGNGSFSMPLPLPAGQKFLLTMSDADGFGTGGTSDVLTTGSKIGDGSCNTTEANPDFYFQLNSALQQCRMYTFSEYYDAVQPVTIIGLIPLGQTFLLHPPTGPSSFDWRANVAAGTSVSFVIVDAEGRSGGSSDLKVVGVSDEASCIDANSPRSTISGSTTPTSPVFATETVRLSSGERTGIIVGAVLGTFAFFALLALVVLCLLRRKRRAELEEQPRESSDTPRRPAMAFVNNSSGNTSRVSRVRSSLLPSTRRRTPLDLLPHRPSPLTRITNAAFPSASTLPPQSEYEPNPFMMPYEASVATNGHSNRGFSGRRHSYSPSHTFSNSGSDPEVTNPSAVHSHSRHSHPIQSPRSSLPLSYLSGTGSRKASMVGLSMYSPTPRLVLHTDAEDALSAGEGEEEGIVELPPQYTDRRDASPKPGAEPRPPRTPTPPFS